MSLPTRAVFIMNDGSVKISPANIGWHFSPEYIPNTVLNSVNEYNIGKDWECVILYEGIYTKRNLRDIHENSKSTDMVSIILEAQERYSTAFFDMWGKKKRYNDSELEEYMKSKYNVIMELI